MTHSMYTDPLEQFQAWYAQAGHESLWRRIFTRLYPPAVIHQPDAMILATADAAGKPSARVVLLKSANKNGLTFFTNYTSQKGQELIANPKVAIVFHWAFPERQVRIEGIAKKVTRQESEAYWQTRPRGSQLSGSASPQSAVIANRASLVERVDEIKKQVGSGEIPCPQEWGGFLVVPERIEFWEARINRLHERTVFKKHGDAWKSEMLAP